MNAHAAPPSALDAEAAVISTCMLEPSRLDEVMLSPRDFFSLQNATIFGVLRELRAANDPIDIVTVNQRLRDTGRQGDAGGPSFLSQLIDATPKEAHVLAHARLVAEKAKLRRLIATCQTIAAKAYGEAGDVSEFLSDAEAKVCAIADERDHEGPVHALDAIRSAFASIVAADEGKTEENPPIPTGLVSLDRALQLRRQRVTTLAAATGIGKTTIALQVAVARAMRRMGVLFVSLEMPREQLMRRAVFQLAAVDASKNTKPAGITADEWKRLTDAAERISRSPFYVDDAADQNPLSIRASVRRARAQARRGGVDLDLVVVDYMQLVDGRGSGRDANREQQVSYIARRLKVLSREENVHVLALAQLNGDFEKQDRRPRMSDLRESKAIAMHSDNVVIIHAPHAGERSDRLVRDYAEPEGEEVSVYIDKQRDGAAGRVDLLFFPGQTRFVEGTR